MKRRPIGEAGATDDPAFTARDVGWLVAMTIAVVALYRFLWPALTGDMTLYLVPWYETIVERGRIAAFAAPFANYTPPYLYLLSGATLFDGFASAPSIIKGLSVAGTLALAAATWRLVAACGVAQGWKAAMWVLLLPTVAINAPGFGQADALWSAAGVMAVAAAVERRTTAMLVWAAIGFALKAQGIFIAPFVVAALIGANGRWWHWAVPVLVFAGAMLPAIMIGWPAENIAGIYMRQAEWVPRFLGNAANPWSLVQQVVPETGWAWRGIGFVFAGLSSAAYIAWLARRRMTAPVLVAAALLAATMVPWLLPKMHERFFFLADILAFALAWIVRDRRTVTIAVLIQAASLLALAGMMIKSYWLPSLGAALTGVAMLLTIAMIAGPYRTRLTNILPSRSSVRNSGSVAMRSLNLEKP